MALDLPGGVVQAQEEVLVEEAPVRVEWEVAAPEQDPVGIVFAPIVGQRFLIERELLAIT